MLFFTMGEAGLELFLSPLFNSSISLLILDGTQYICKKMIHTNKVLLTFNKINTGLVLKRHDTMLICSPVRRCNLYTGIWKEAQSLSGKESVKCSTIDLLPHNSLL